MLLVSLLACEPCGVEAAEDCGETPHTLATSPDDTAIESGEAVIYAKVEDCSLERWYYAFDLSVFPTGGELLVSGPDDAGGRREETHPLEALARANWQLEVDLLVVADPADHAPGVTTTFGCDQADALTWRLYVNEADGARSCLVWGADPALVMTEGCDEW